MLYRYRNVAMALAVGAVAAFALLAAPAVWVDGLVWIAFLSVLYDWWLRVCEERFPLVRVVGWILWTISVHGADRVRRAGGIERSRHVGVGRAERARGRAGADLAWWMIVAPIMLVWFCASLFASRRRGAGAPAGAPVNVHAKSSVATGRVGLFVSLGFFIIVTMTSWALVNTGVERSVEHVPYLPFLFTQSLTPVAGDATSPGQTTAGLFLDERFVNSTSGFSVIAFLLSPVVLYLVLMLLPSVLAELGSSHSSSGCSGAG